MSVEVLTEVEERHSAEAIEAEIQRFEERVQQLQSGEITAEQFRPFRLKHGTYGQRQPGFQRSEERRVGKEWRSRRSRDHKKRKGEYRTECRTTPSTACAA